MSGLPKQCSAENERQRVNLLELIVIQLKEMIMRNVGDYEWQQLSMWDFAPKNCIEKFIKSECGGHIFHYYLKRISEIVSDDHWKVETVTSTDGVPDDVLKWRNSDYKVRGV